MESDRFAQLTDRECDCLRLVSRGHSSKEIAAELGISHHTVDLHLKRAIKTLKASDRRDAARRLAAAEADQLVADAHPQGLVTQPAALVESPKMPAMMHPNRSEPGPRFRVPFLREGRQFNDLTPVKRLVWIPVLAILFLIIIANFLNGLSVLFAITS